MTLKQFNKPVLGFAAYSGTGKTTLLVKLLPLLREKGIRVAMIKHAHHDFDIDKPGKDSYELRKAGADQILISSDQRCALVEEYGETREPQLDKLIERLDLEKVDIVLVEGFRHLAFDKIELHRPSLGREKIFESDSNVIAVVTDEPVETGELPRLDINNADAVVEFVRQWLVKQMNNE